MFVEAWGSCAIGCVITGELSLVEHSVFTTGLGCNQTSSQTTMILLAAGFNISEITFEFVIECGADKVTSTVAGMMVMMMMTCCGMA